MKIAFPILILMLASTILFAQTENHTIAIENFQTNYNKENYVEIFNSFSPEMQKALPLENTKQFLTSLMFQFGKIANKELIDYPEGAYAAYKTKFEKSILTINISLDKQHKINGMYIKPYQEPTHVENKTVDALASYPQKIAELIYSKAKDFPNNTQLSIALTQNGRTNYYGVIKLNDTIKTIENENRIFEIGSITKVFTSAILASLVLENKIDLADEINTYYPFDFKDHVKIRFRDLANHTSGLPRLPENLDLSNELNPYKNYGKKELEEYLKNIVKLESDSSGTYSYSNLGTGLLGHTLGLSQKTSFQKLLQKRIFDKYKMTHTYTSVQNTGDKLIKGLDKNGRVAPNWDFDVLLGCGGILSTTEDLAKFAAAQFNPGNKELVLTRNPTFVVNEKMKMGLGWHILKSGQNQDLFWHNGGTGGYSSSITVNVHNKTAAIILSNVSAYHANMKNIDELCFALISQLEKN